MNEAKPKLHIDKRESYISEAMSGALSNPLADQDEEYKDQVELIKD